MANLERMRVLRPRGLLRCLLLHTSHNTTTAGNVSLDMTADFTYYMYKLKVRGFLGGGGGGGGGVNNNSPKRRQ